MAWATGLRRRPLAAATLRLCRAVLRPLVTRRGCKLVCLLSCVVLALDVATYNGKLFMCNYGGAFDELGSAHVDVIPLHHVTEIEDRWGDVYLTSNLRELPVPLTVHFVWCNTRPFHYRHYLSVLSVYKLVKPTSITFHYDEEPELDNVGYFQFYLDLKQSVPNFFTQPITDRAVCSSDPMGKLLYAFKFLNAKGGIYVDEDVILSRPLVAFRKGQLSHSLPLSGDFPYRGIVLAAADVIGQAGVTKASVQQLLQTSAATFTCPDLAEFKDRTDVRCVQTTDDVFPVQVWEDPSDFGQLARWVGYGSSKVLVPVANSQTVIPLIVHYVWLGKRQLSFSHYLSLLSCLCVVEARTVYIHGDYEPEGELWDKVKRVERVKFIHRRFPSSVFGNDIVAWASHASDYLRADLLLRYGGVYMDWDVLWVSPIPDSLRRYDFVAGVDWPEAGAFPDVFNMGVLLARPGAGFLRFFLESYHHYLDTHWSYNAINMPYKVYEKHPDLLYNYRHLQVICFRLKCHPTWLPGYKDYQVHHLSGAPFDWRRETLTMHWTNPDPPEFYSRETLLQSRGMAAEIGHFILQAARKAGLD